LQDFLSAPGRRVLFVAESTGRREMLAEHLAGFNIRARQIEGWQSFIDGDLDWR
jgi:transcription-repair coupling factor (superfamily II helicase)